MLKCDWRKVTEARLIAFGVSILLVGLALSVWAFLGQQNEYASQRQHEATYQANAAQQRVEACRTIMAKRGFLDWLACFAEAKSAQVGAVEPDYNLQAQQDASEWALGSLLISILTFGAGLIGIIYVAGNFRQTRTALAHAEAANAIAREIGEKQVRAYLEVRSITIGHDGTNECLTFACKIRNTGQSPAISADLVAEVTLFYDNGTPKKFIIPMYTAGVPVSGAKIPTVSCVDAKLARDEFAIASACHAEVLLFGTDVFGKEAIEHSYFTVFGHPDPGYVFRVANRAPIPAPVLSQERLNALIAQRVGSRGSNG